MKKTYINPELTVIEIKANHQLLAGSLGNNDTPYVNFDAVDEDDSLEGLYAD